MPLSLERNLYWLGIASIVGAGLLLHQNLSKEEDNESGRYNDHNCKAPTRKVKYNSAALPTSRQLQQIFPILKRGKRTISVEILIKEYKKLNGSLSDTELRAKILKHKKDNSDDTDDNVLRKHELAEVCAELGFIEMLRQKEMKKYREALPPHLLFGISIEGIKEYLKSLPHDAIKQCNDEIPLGEDSKPKFPPNTDLNGYVNQFHIRKATEEDGLAHCERLKDKSPHVGEAKVFVSWYLKTPLTTLIDALEEYLRNEKLPTDTKIWLCDFVIRQTTRKLSEKENDVKKLGECVRSVGHTVLLTGPWNDPQPLRRAYCIKEVYHTQAGWAKFNVILPSTQQADFNNALIKDFGSIMKSFSNIDVRTTHCLKKKDTDAILHELKTTVGFVECNSMVIGLIREALVCKGQEQLDQLPTEERGTSVLINSLSKLLRSMGKLEEAKIYYKEALQARREKLGNQHPSTLTSISNMGSLLREMGKLEEAKIYHQEALQRMREKLGNQHPSTLTSISNMGSLLREMGKLEEARIFNEEALQGMREKLGNQHPSTLISISNMGSLLKNMGKLEEARIYYEEALQGRREKLGNQHQDTLISIGSMELLLKNMGKLEEAKTYYQEASQPG